MPAPVRLKPEFTPYGRYLLNVDDRKTPGPTFFHDTDNISEACGLANAPTNSLSRFNNNEWAIERGYKPCMNCVEHKKEIL